MSLELRKNIMSPVRRLVVNRGFVDHKLIVRLVVLLVVLALAAIVFVWIKNRSAAPAPTVLSAISARSPDTADRKQLPRPARRTAPPTAPASVSAARPEAAAAASPVLAAQPESTAPAVSAAAPSPAEVLQKSRDREALQMANRQLDALNLTDLQRQTAQDTLDQLRTEWAAIQRDKWNTAFGEALNRKIADFRRQGLVADKIVELIRPEVAAEADRKNALLDQLAATALKLRPSLTPDQIATLDARITIEQAAGGAVVKEFLTSDAYLKGVVQSVR